MRTIDETKTVYHLFDSVDDYVRFADGVPWSRCGEHLNFTSTGFIGRKFSGWDDVKTAVRTAWPEGLDILGRMVRDLDEAQLDAPRCRRRRMRFSEDDGDELDYDRLRSGQPYWRTSRRESARGPATVTIIVDAGANANVKHQDILWRGAAAIALTKRLEAAGYRVELWSADYSELTLARGRTYDTDLLHAVCLKRPGDPLDESTLIAAVAGWFYRTVNFRAVLAGNRPVNPSLGKHRAPTPKELDHVSRDENRVLVAETFSYGSAVDLVRRAIVNLKTF